MKIGFILLGILLTVSFAYAQVNINQDPIETDGVVIQSPVPKSFSNASFNQSLGDGLWWRLDGTNAPPTANWLMNNFGFENVGVTNFTDAVTLEDNNNLTLIDGIINVTRSIGIGLGADLSHELDVHGHVEIEHTADEIGDHALEIDLDSGTFGDVKALFIDYDTGAIELGQDEEVIFINVDQFSALGGDITGLEIVTTEGGANVTGLEVGIEIHPLRQLSGIFGNMDSALNNGVDVLTEFTSEGSDVTMFAADNDNVDIGNLERFEEIEFILDTTAGGGGIAPVFYFSTGVNTWVEFTPADGTSGMRDSGVIIWEDSDIPSWATGLDSEFLIRINRTRNNIPRDPIEDLVQIAVAEEFFWDKDARLLVDTINVTGEGINFLDNVNATFGTGGDATLRYDGSNLLIDTRFVGAGNFRLIGDAEFQIRDNLASISSPSSGELRFTVSGIGAVITFFVQLNEIMRFGLGGVIFNEGGLAGNDIRAETNNNINGMFLDSGIDAFGVLAGTNLASNFTVNGTSNLEGNVNITENLNVHGNITNGVCGSTGTFTYSESGTHTSGLSWFSGQTRNARGWRALCNGVITGMTVGWDVDPSGGQERVHVHINNADVNCMMNITDSEGNNVGKINNTCSVPFSSGDAIKVEGDFGGGVTSLNDGVAMVNIRWTY